MDRNDAVQIIVVVMRTVALRKESVDRNPPVDTSSVRLSVALRKESVDRNRLAAGSLIMLGGSLSARRAWIEIQSAAIGKWDKIVALRKESVDRNLSMGLDGRFKLCRSPQGERG